MSMLQQVQRIQPKSATQIPEPPIARFLFADSRMAWFWLIVRVYAGFQWFDAGLGKLTGHPLIGEAEKQWVFSGHDGAAIKGFVIGALSKTSGANPSVQNWYAWFLTHFVQPNPALWAYLITFGELLVGIGLIVGALTGIAAFFGLVMNLNYLLAGTVSTNPILGGIAILLVLAWRIGGYYGVDRYLLPLLGTPWTGKLTEQPAAKQVEQPRKPLAGVAH